MSDHADHPTIQEIVAIRGGLSVEKPAEDVMGHVATCERCHGIYSALMSLEKWMGDSFPEGESTPFCPEDWEVAAFIAGESPRKSASISAHLNSCRYCLDRAASYQKALAAVPGALQAPESWKREAIRILEKRHAPPEKSEVRSPIIQRVRRFFKELVPPLPPLPGYIAAAVAVALLIWVSTGERGKILIIPSTERIAYRDTEPSGTMGFMEQGEERSESRMKINVGSGSVYFRWGPIDNLPSASFVLIEKSSRVTVFKKEELEGSEVRVPERVIRKGNVYTWSIEGRTLDGRPLEYSGEFFLTRGD